MKLKYSMIGALGGAVFYGAYRLTKKKKSYRVGVDIVDMRRDVDLDKLANYILSEDELEHYTELREVRKREYLFGHLAAKEAYLKACGKGLSAITIRSIEVKYDMYGKPYLNQDYCDLSISHDGDYAVANVIVYN